MGNRSKNKGVKEKPPAAAVTTEVLLADIAVKHTRAKGFRALLTLAGLAFPVLASWPVANELAGENTQLQVSIALGISVTVTLAGVGAALWGNEQRRRANKLDQRNKRLARDVSELQGRLEANGLSTKLSSEPSKGKKRGGRGASS